MMNQAAYFLGGLRTIFGVAQKGSWAQTRPDDLLAQLVLDQKKIYPDLWETSPAEMIVGCAYPEGEQGYNIARTASLGAGLDVPGFTINRLCGSSLEAVTSAAAFVASGRGGNYLIGGVESMSRIPRRGVNFSESDKIKTRCESTYVTMGETAENVAQEYSSISRTEQEDFACRSHELTARAYAEGFYSHQVMGNGAQRDESLRYPVNREKISSLVPVFSNQGVVTAATSSPMSDGACVGSVVSDNYIRGIGARDALRIVDVVTTSIDPKIMGMGPVQAVAQLLRRNQFNRSDIVAIEMNEAFAIQSLACVKELELPMEIVNSKGGALAIGHPLGASGLRLMMTLHQRLRENAVHGAHGIVTLCVGGGQGMAVLCEFIKF